MDVRVMASKRIRSKREKQRLLLRLFWIFFFIVAVCVFLDWKMRPLIKKSAMYQAKTTAVQAINDAVNEELENLGVNYNSFVTLVKNEQGDIAAIQTDTVASNKINAALLDAVMERLSDPEQQEIRLPIGTLLGGAFLSGLGSDIHFRVIPEGYVESELKSSFQTAGINQTLHQIVFEIHVTVTALIPGYSQTTEVTNSFQIAQTVIVGEVPESFTEVTDGESSTLSKINDYNAQTQKEKTN